MITAVAVIFAFALAMVVYTKPRTCEQCAKRAAVGQGTSLKELVDGFREYASLVDGAVSPEVDTALERLVATETKKELPTQVKVLEGEAMLAYQGEFDAGTTAYERGNVVRRWHKKWYRFPTKFRNHLLKIAADQAFRDELRKMFDEQDERLNQRDA